MLELKKRLLRDKIGLSADLKSSQELLNQAIRLEEIKNDVGPHDPSFLHYAEQQKAYEEAALIAEQEGR